MGSAVSSHPQVGLSATPDRLAEPTLPASPSQADHGAQVYWLSCLPCHGDFGQGLTDEFRAVYPAEDRNCWDSGCHGKQPYENGFTIPTQIAAIIGPGTLQKFPNAANLRGYISAAMPFWKPGSLTEEESWQVTAFLLRENGLWEAREELNASNADQVRVGAGGGANASPTGPGSADPSNDASWSLVAGSVLVLTLLFLFVFLQRQKKGS
jgi:hypothetical protein